MNNLQEHKRNTKIGGGIVFILAAVGYAFTIAPTVSFWDCGEYIGACHSLGIPHPPGNPLYVLIGRVFSIMLGFIDQVALRINIISLLAGAFSSLLVYLIIVRVMVGWMGLPDTLWKKLTVYIAGFTGALYTAFGYTFWFSAVESSVYIPSVLVVLLCTWIVLKWSQSKSSKRDILLIFFAYISFLGIGIHMMSMIAIIPAFIYVLLVDKEKRSNLPFIFTGILMGSVIYNTSWFIWLGPIVTLGTLSMAFIQVKTAKNWRFCFYIAFFALLGYSVHFYIPIRSELKPMIDENHPVVRLRDDWRGLEWDAFKNFLERKQYGSESMILRMFHRRGAWSKQFGIDGHMGYGGFHLTQYFHFGRSIRWDRENSLFKTWGTFGGTARLLIYLIPTFFVFFGMYQLWKRDKKTAAFLGLLLLLTTVGLVIYMNFADGDHCNRQDYQRWVSQGRQGPKPTVHREVRIRDYFFTSGFVAISMWIGISIGILLSHLFRSKDRYMRTVIAPTLVILFAASPALPFASNYKEIKRTYDWIPFDYAYNLLMSCAKDGILFTNGDNDTFPLWFMQEAAGIRRDVRVVNLSLLNTKWYIKQLKEKEPKVPINYTEREIDVKVNHKRNPRQETQRYTYPNAGITVMRPGQDRKRILKVQDQMVEHIVDANAWKKPIYFAVTVSRGNMMGLQPYLKMEGLVYEIQPNPVPEEKRLDVDKTVYKLNQVYRFTNLGNGKAPMSETAIKLMSNYAAGFIQVALHERPELKEMKNRIANLAGSLNDTTGTADTSSIEREKVLEETQMEYQERLDRLVNLLDQCVTIMPWDWRPRVLRQEILLEHGLYKKGEDKINEALMVNPDKKEYLELKGKTMQSLGKKSEAADAYLKAIKRGASNMETYKACIRLLNDLSRTEEAERLKRQFQQQFPGDKGISEAGGNRKMKEKLTKEQAKELIRRKRANQNKQQ